MRGMTDRWIDIEGVVNMRDLGGLPLSGGGTVPRGVLIRSDNLQDLSPAAVEYLLERVGVTDVVDLRTTVERLMEGHAPLERAGSIQHHHLSLLAEDVAPAREDALGLPWRGEHRPRDAAFWADHYLGYLSARPDSVSAALQAVARARGATVVHCAAGKDRTGTVIALALDAAGVPHEHIVGDYLLTQHRLSAIMDRLRARAAYRAALADQSLRDQAPRAASIEAILGALQQQWGGTPGWLMAVAGWSSDEVERLRVRLSGAGPR